MLKIKNYHNVKPHNDLIPPPSPHPSYPQLYHQLGTPTMKDDAIILVDDEKVDWVCVRVVNRGTTDGDNDECTMVHVGCDCVDDDCWMVL